jgi:hypothetical protein
MSPAANAEFDLSARPTHLSGNSQFRGFLTEARFLPLKSPDILNFTTTDGLIYQKTLHSTFYTLPGLQLVFPSLYQRFPNFQSQHLFGKVPVPWLT